jgi:histidinol-phosphate/aromatic aminotransferase/cobyric acid decarboxylase-like protein
MHLKNITRYESPEVSEGLVRLHKAERDLDFSKGFIQGFLDTISYRDITCYPSPNRLYSNLSDFLGVASSSVFFGDGSDRLIRSSIECFSEIGDAVAIPDPGFPMYKVYCDILSRGVCSYEVRPEATPETIFCNIRSCLEIHRPRLLFLANPMSPFGQFFGKEYLESLIEICLELRVILIIDEAYIDFVDEVMRKHVDFTLSQYVIYLRTFSKGWGSAGMRLGFAVTHETNIALFKKNAPMNLLTGLSIKWGNYLLLNYSEIESYVLAVRKNRAEMVKWLKINRFKIIAGQLNWIWAQAHLIDNNIFYIVDANFNQSKWLKLGVMPHMEDNHRLLGFLSYSDG